MSFTSRRSSRPSALPRRGHVPPRGAEFDEWDGGKDFPATLRSASATPTRTRHARRLNASDASERHDMNRDLRARRLNPTTLRSTGVLVLRVVVGVTFLLHGLDKLGDLAGTEQLFVSLGIPAPALMAPLVAVTEAVGGVLLIAGLATPLVGAALAIDMLVALLTAHLGEGFFVRDGGIELTLLLGGASLGIGLVGAGRFSLDASLDLPERVLRRVGAVSS
jgi:putative oxidoreductase